MTEQEPLKTTIITAIDPAKLLDGPADEIVTLQLKDGGTYSFQRGELKDVLGEALADGYMTCHDGKIFIIEGKSGPTLKDMAKMFSRVDKISKARSYYAASFHDKLPQLKRKQRAGRNEPCPCGSGKKYKVCCMRVLT